MGLRLCLCFALALIGKAQISLNDTLRDACANGDFEAMRAALKKGANPNAVMNVAAFLSISRPIASVPISRPVEG
jgi:hypothetical protein